MSVSQPKGEVSTDEHRWAILERRAQEIKAVRAFQTLRSRKIEPILIKGLAASYYYPPNRSRPSVDMDLAVHSRDFLKAVKICHSTTVAGLAIDVHRELRHLDTVDWDDLFANSITIEIEGTPLRFLRPEDHLRVLCLHWLTDGGANKGRLWDIYYMVKNRPETFSWERLLDKVTVRRQRWILCVLGLAARYLDLDLGGTPAEAAATDLPKWLIKTVEREWASDIPVRPLSTCLRDRHLLFQQLRKRLPPNPIQATVDVEGSFDAKTRVHYQIVSALKRAVHNSRMSPPKRVDA